jgi:hypothetical protein
VAPRGHGYPSGMASTFVRARPWLPGRHLVLAAGLVGLVPAAMPAGYTTGPAPEAEIAARVMLVAAAALALVVIAFFAGVAPALLASLVGVAVVVLGLWTLAAVDPYLVGWAGTGDPGLLRGVEAGPGLLLVFASGIAAVVGALWWAFDVVRARRHGNLVAVDGAVFLAIGLALLGFWAVNLQHGAMFWPATVLVPWGLAMLLQARVGDRRDHAALDEPEDAAVPIRETGDGASARRRAG